MQATFSYQKPLQFFLCYEKKTDKQLTNCHRPGDNENRSDNCHIVDKKNRGAAPVTSNRNTIVLSSENVPFVYHNLTSQISILHLFLPQI